jgi:FMN phosphatase YigB (HAD superfamily)
MRRVRPILVLDFDGVVFDAGRFKRVYRKTFAERGVPRRIFEKTYRAAVSGFDGRYWPRLHFSLLKKELPHFHAASARQAVKQAILQAHRFLYADALRFLRQRQRAGRKPILLSAGNPWFQRAKIVRCGIKKYFRKIIIVERESKKDILRGLALRAAQRMPSVIFVDDNENVIKEAGRGSPGIAGVQMCRRGQPARPSSPPIARNFQELSRILTRYEEER